MKTLIFNGSPRRNGDIKNLIYELIMIYSYMKYTNLGSQSVALKNGMKIVKEFEDTKNTITKVYAINRKELENKLKYKRSENAKTKILN